MEKRYYWLRLKDDFFKSKQMKKLRKIAGGDTYTIIYLKMMLSSLTNDGVIEYEGVEDSFAEELALDLDEDQDNVEVVLSFLQRYGLMVERENNQYELPEAKECIGSETAGAQRVRDHRARQKALQCNTEVTPMLQGETDALRQCCVEKEKEKEKEIDINTLSNDNVSSDESDAPIVLETKDNSPKDVKHVLDEWNRTDLPKIIKISPNSKRYRMLVARIREYGIDNVLKAIGLANNSKFCKESTFFDFEWFVKPNNFPKVLEGKYNDSGGGRGGGGYGRSAGQQAESEELTRRREWSLARAEALASAQQLSAEGKLEGFGL